MNETFLLFAQCIPNAGIWLGRMFERVKALIFNSSGVDNDNDDDDMS